MVFQHLALFPMMNVAENIAYGLRCRGADKAEITRKVRDVLERIGLPGVETKEIHQLSGGQKQRIAIARCMVLEPDVLLLDEPLGALDLKLRERMKIELKLLQHQFDTTFVYITHDQSEALVMSDRVAVMNAGPLRADRRAAGALPRIRRRPSSPASSATATAGPAAPVSDGGMASCRDPSIVADGHRSRCSPVRRQCGRVFVRPEFIRTHRKSGGACRQTRRTTASTACSTAFSSTARRAAFWCAPAIGALIEVGYHAARRQRCPPGRGGGAAWSPPDTPSAFPAEGTAMLQKDASGSR
jgi:spermidine/putrescine transport system ATP-binding protein